MLYRRSALPLVLIVCFCLTSCSSLAPSPTSTPTQTQPPTKTPTPSPTVTKTPIPTLTITPTPEPSPTSSCDPDEVLAKLKSFVPYDEFTLHYNSIDGIPSLVIWYVEPWIELPIDEETIVAQSLIVTYLALRTSATLNRADKCVGVLFEYIKPIVVDSDYNGWFAGAVKVSDLPSGSQTSADDLLPAQESLVVAYQRQVPPSPISGQPGSEGTCDWPEANERIRWHFSSELQNVSFYFVIDETGVNVWANWVGYGDPLELEFASLLNIAMELQCLHPPLDWLWVIVVHDNGAPKLIGRVPGEAVYVDDFMEKVINQFQVVYP